MGHLYRWPWTVSRDTKHSQKRYAGEFSMNLSKRLLCGVSQQYVLVPFSSQLFVSTSRMTMLYWLKSCGIVYKPHSIQLMMTESPKRWCIICLTSEKSRVVNWSWVDILVTHLVFIPAIKSHIFLPLFEPMTVHQVPAEIASHIFLVFIKQDVTLLISQG